MNTDGKETGEPHVELLPVCWVISNETPLYESVCAAPLPQTLF
jgi:hypothetical protein